MYEHEDGVLARSYPESEWDDLQQGWMLALALWDSTRCDQCGGDLRETVEHDDWVANLPVQCHRCAAIRVKQQQYVRDYPEQMHSLRWSANRRGVRAWPAR